MPVYRRVLLSVAVAALLVAGLTALVGLAQGPGDAWLVRLPCRDEVALRRLLGSGMRVVLWQDGQAYALATAEGRNWLAARGLMLQALNRRAPQGEYYIVRATAEEAAALQVRYGRAVALGEGYYLLGLPPGQEITEAIFAYRLPHSVQPPRPPAPALLQPPAVGAALNAIVGEVSQARLQNDVAELQDDHAQPGLNALGSRYTFSTGLDAAAGYIAGELRAAGLEVEHFSVSYSRPFSDVVGILHGTHPESEGFFIVCAHYDSTAQATPNWNWQNMPAPGADDNGSGAAAVLEAARVLSGHALAYGVRFCLFAGEEQGLVGSSAYAQALADAGANILGVINLDMIAYDGNGDGRMELRVNNTEASRALAEAMARNLARYAPSLQPAIITDASRLSDHAPFWDRGYAAFLAIEDWKQHTPYYHTVNDTLDTLNMGLCLGMARAAAGALGELGQLEPRDLSRSTKEVTPHLALPGDVLGYSITLLNRGYLTASATLTDYLPGEVTLEGNISAGPGVTPPTWLEEERRLTWAGEVAPQAAVAFAFGARVATDLAAGMAITNAATLDDGQGGVYGLAAPVRVLWRQVLPVIWR